MTPEAQRIAIAEACGWYPVAYPQDGYATAYKWQHPDGRKGWGFSAIPDYPNDLNAMHEAEKTLSFSQETKYVANLMKQHKEYPMTTGFLATAAQRAEAFLRTIGKWKEVRK